MKHHQFKKHPKKLMALIVLVSLTLAVFGVELFLAFIKQEGKEGTIVRTIRLKEHMPLTVRFVTPKGKALSQPDSSGKTKYRFKIDEDGYIYPSKIHERPDITIIFLGGSTTECTYVDEKARFPYLVGRLLENDGKKVNSFNSGVSGNHSLHSIDIFLNKGLKLNPNVAVMMHNANDLNTLLYEKTYWNDNPTRSLVIASNNKPPLYISVKNILYKILPNIYNRLSKLKHIYFNNNDDEFARLRGKRLFMDKNAILEKFGKNLMSFINISNAHGVTPVLMTQANRFKKEPDGAIRVIMERVDILKDFGMTYSEYRYIYMEINKLIRQIGISNNVLVIDLAQEVPKSNEYMYDTIHLNNNGSKYVASIIYKQLRRLFHK